MKLRPRSFDGYHFSTDIKVEVSDLNVGLVVEGVPTELGTQVTKAVNVPTIGIGAGPGCDGQVLVWHDLLGLYDGVALTDREANYTAGLPDRILIFRGPLLELCDTVAELEEEVHITVVHEVAHHFGIDDDRLHDLGYA